MRLLGEGSHVVVVSSTIVGGQHGVFLLTTCFYCRYSWLVLLGRRWHGLVIAWHWECRLCGWVCYCKLWWVPDLGRVGRWLPIGRLAQTRGFSLSIRRCSFVDSRWCHRRHFVDRGRGRGRITVMNTAVIAYENFVVVLFDGDSFCSRDDDFLCAVHFLPQLRVIEGTLLFFSRSVISCRSLVQD